MIKDKTTTQWPNKYRKRDADVASINVYDVMKKWSKVIINMNSENANIMLFGIDNMLQLKRGLQNERSKMKKRSLVDNDINLPSGQIT